MNKKILITGGCGFIGANAALSFAAQGHTVVVADNFSRKGSEVNKALLEKNSITILPSLDVSHEAQRLAEIVDQYAFDAIIHAAAQVAVTTSVADPLFDFRSNALGTLHVLEAARAAKKQPHVLFTSTNKVYGGMEQVGISEQETRYVYTDLVHGVPESLPLDFHSPYGCSKGSADQYVHDYARMYNFPTTVFRQSCIYGPNQFGIVDQGWVAYLTMLAFFDKPITLFGDGKQVRDILFVSDLVAAMQAALDRPETSGGEIFNMGGGPTHTLSLLEFVAFLEERLGKKVVYTHSDWRPGDQKVYISDVRKAQEKLGWSPETPFEKGFDAMFAWIEENKDLLIKYV
ncbi:MAG: CDP-paratose 2-epimerase [Patescibacteria group bacterium]|nr:CDP-paratose 2-epimerase [Patescibacteria group bacterium]